MLRPFSKSGPARSRQSSMLHDKQVNEVFPSTEKPTRNERWKKQRFIFFFLIEVNWLETLSDSGVQYNDVVVLYITKCPQVWLLSVQVVMFWLYTLCCTLHSCALFYIWKSVPLNPPHLFHSPTHLPTSHLAITSLFIVYINLFLLCCSFVSFRFHISQIHML